jgi:hypothetical protein
MANIADIKKRKGKKTIFLFLVSRQVKNKNKNKTYPIIPHTATGTFKNMAYLLCETVSQFILFDIAQKLLYAISV